LRVCSRSNIAGADLKFGRKSFKQQTLIGSINRTVDDMTLQLGDVKNSLIEIENKTSDIALVE
jgi:hypothetical protein